METRVIKRILYAILGTMCGQVVLGVILLWNDHFEIKGITNDMALIKPRVEQLWWQAEVRKTRAELGKMPKTQPEIME